MVHKRFFQFTVPMSLLPPTTSTFTFYQSVHFHRLEPSYAKRLFWRAAEVPPTPSPLNFVGATCPGFDPREEVDWRGCNSDARYSCMILEKLSKLQLWSSSSRLLWGGSTGEYSEEWQQAVGERDWQELGHHIFDPRWT